MSLEQVALAGECDAGLTLKVRTAIDDAYGCSQRGTRCIDGHTGRTIFDSGKYVTANRATWSAGPGTMVTVVVFALSQCAPERLAGIEFKNGLVKSHDTSKRTALKTALDSGEIDAIKNAADATKDTQDKVKAAVESISKAAAKVDKSLPASDTRCTDPDGCSMAREGLRGFVSTEREVSTSALDQFLDTAERSVAAPDRSGVKVAVQDARTSFLAEKTGIQQTLSTLAFNVTTELQSESPRVLTVVQPRLAVAEAAAATGDITAVQSELDRIKDELQVAKALIAKPNAEPWRGVTIGGASVSMVQTAEPVPTGDDISRFVVTTSNVASHSENARIWPSNTLSVKVKHGSYYWDFGVMFAAVSKASSQFAATATSTSEPSSYGWKHQPMLVGSVYPGGRDKFVPWAGKNLIPGIQAGVNMDVTKIAEAVSLGLILEPVGGLAVSGGAMFFARAKAPASADGKHATEHVLLPYMGITLNAEFYNSIKSVVSSDDDGQ